MRHAIHSIYKTAAELVTSPLTKSQFEEKRNLTPDEFVAAGEFLVRACPTWSWEGGDPKKRRQYLPSDKQYLVTRNVPCIKRASDLEKYDINKEYTLQGDEDGWVATHRDPLKDAGKGDTEDIPSIEDHVADAGNDDDVPDIGELDLDDEAAAPLPTTGYLRAEEPEDAIMRTRTYDLYITYDQYYHVPRLWLIGYDETKQFLMPTQVLEDVSEEHARKTVTVDPFPHLSLTAASIHPCRHADVMKKLVDNMIENGGDFKVEHYLLLFLKFIASVVPTIQYDYTMSVGGS